MQFPTLYKTTNGKKIQQWTIEVDGNRYRTISGQQNGKLVTSEYTVCSGKNIGRANETTPEAQALSEAQSRFDSKLETYVQNLSEIGTIAEKKFIVPMKAENVKDYRDRIVYPVYLQPKLDGMRCVGQPTGLFSREGKPINLPHIKEVIDYLIVLHPTAVFDGELYVDSLKQDFNSLISLVKKNRPGSEAMQYWIYDLIVPGTFSERSARLKDIFKDVPVAWKDRLVFVPTEIAHDEETVNASYAAWLDKGVEGQMIRLDVPYRNKRTWEILKQKPDLDAEYEIVSINEGNGNRSGMAGNVTLKLDGDRTFNASIKGNRAYCIDLLKNANKYAGSKATIHYQNLTPDGVPRFPRMKVIRDYE